MCFRNMRHRACSTWLQGFQKGNAQGKFEIFGASDWWFHFGIESLGYWRLTMFTTTAVYQSQPNRLMGKFLSRKIEFLVPASLTT